NFFRFMIRRYLFCRDVKSEQQALNSLQQSVVKLPRYANPFVCPLLRSHPNGSCRKSQAEPIRNPEKTDSHSETETNERAPFVETREDRKGHGRHRPSPHIVPTRSHHLKCVSARTQMRIDGLGPRPYILPSSVESIQPVSVNNVLRTAKIKTEIP